MLNHNHPSNELYDGKRIDWKALDESGQFSFRLAWPDRCDKPNWLVSYLLFVSFLCGTIVGIGLAYLMTN